MELQMRCDMIGSMFRNISNPNSRCTGEANSSDTHPTTGPIFCRLEHLWIGGLMCARAGCWQWVQWALVAPSRPISLRHVPAKLGGGNSDAFSRSSSRPSILHETMAKLPVLFNTIAPSSSDADAYPIPPCGASTATECRLKRQRSLLRRSQDKHLQSTQPYHLQPAAYFAFLG